MNNKYEMMKYLFDVFEIYFKKMKQESVESQISNEIKDNVSCPSMGKKSISLSISTEDTILVFQPESNRTSRAGNRDRIEEFENIKSK